MAGGLAASSPLTWHVVLRFTGAGRDHVEDLGGTSIRGAVGSFCDTCGQLRPHCAGEVLSFNLILSFTIYCFGVLACQCCGKKKNWFRKVHRQKDVVVYAIQVKTLSEMKIYWTFFTALKHNVTHVLINASNPRIIMPDADVRDDSLAFPEIRPQTPTYTYSDTGKLPINRECYHASATNISSTIVNLFSNPKDGH